MVPTMRATIDRAGRIVIPKTLRDKLGLVDGVVFDVVEEADGLRLTPVAPPPRVRDDAGLPVISGPTDVVVTDEDVRRLRDAGRR